MTGSLGVDTDALRKQGTDIHTKAVSSRAEAAQQLPQLLAIEGALDRAGSRKGMANFVAAVTNADRAAVRAWDRATATVETYGVQLFVAGTVFALIDGQGA